MKFQVKNLGPIKNASIDLSRKLTLFCGGNNTGKTYLSYIIYALCNPSFMISLPFSKPWSEYKIGDSFTINMDDLGMMPSLMAEKVQSKLDVVFGLDEDSSLNLLKSFELTLEKKSEEEVADIDLEILSGGQLYLKKGRRPLSYLINSIVRSEENHYAIVQSGFIYHLLATYPVGNAVILPVERNSIYTFNKELSISRNELVEKVLELPKDKLADISQLLHRESKRYPMAIRDGLKVANDLDTVKKNKSAYFELGEEIERGLLDGSIGVSKEGEVTFTSNKTAKDKILPIHMTASLVKTLSSLIIYLKYRAHKNDLIIIDEPEMNLHPDNQILLVKIFGKLINRGLRLLVSTHSDYIIREVNNLIMASSTKEGVYEKAAELGYGKDIALKQSDVAVYYFSYPKGSKNAEVKELKVAENGFAIQSIDESIIEQNRIAEELLGTIMYGRDE